MNVNALDCKLVYRIAMQRHYPGTKSLLGPKVGRFERLANLLTLKEVGPEQYILFVFGVWEGLYAPTPETLANPIQFQHYRKMMVI